MKFLTVTTALAAVAILSACEPSTAGYNRMNEGMTVKEAEAVVGKFSYSEDLGNGEVCYSKPFSADASTDDRVLNVFFIGGAMYKQRISQTPCRD